MRKRFLLPLGVVAMVAAFAAELAITSFTRDGHLTWTNSVSNATYRVEWASTAKGPWQRFEALTNLSSVPATNFSVSAKVPMFYRVVWINPPAPEPMGDWDYQAFDADGQLAVTGRLSIASVSNPINGTFSFRPVKTNTPTYHLIGSGSFGNGHLDSHELILLLSQDWDDLFSTKGRLIGDRYFGDWEWIGWAGESVRGTFLANRSHERR